MDVEGNETDEAPVTTPEGEPEPAPKAGLPQALLDLMATGWDDTVDADVAPLPNAPFHTRRRAAVAERFAGETLVVPTGTLKVRSNDTDHEFRPGTEFAYLTGYYDPDAVLVIGGDGAARLYLRARGPRTSHEFFTSAHGELWVGRRRPVEELTGLYGVECVELATLRDDLSTLDPATTRVLRGLDAGVDAALPATDDGKRDAELAQVLSEMRLVKDEWEIAQLLNAVDATVRAFTDVVRALPADRESSERLVDGVFGMRARHDGNFVGYGTIAAAGAHACTLHWVRNDGVCRPGELLLLDAGVENVHFYTADVTRTLPISGTFTPVQRRVYDIVLAAQEAGIAAVRPGTTWKAISDAVHSVLAHGLADLGVLPCAPAEALSRDSQVFRRWTLHSFGHMLGIDVHDCAHAREEVYRDGVIEPGYVLTVEPGLYFQPDDLLVPEELRGIGVRIEDDVLVTDEGCRVLSAALPRRAEDVEAWMASVRSATDRSDPW